MGWEEKHGTGYRGVTRIDGKKVHGPPESKRSSARAWWVEVERASRRGEYVDLKASSQITVADWVQTWSSQRFDASAHTAAGIKRDCARITKDLGHLALTDVTPGRVRAWIADLQRGSSSRPLAPRTTRALHAVLSMILQAAVDEQHLFGNACNATSKSLPRAAKKEHVLLDHAGVTRLIEAAHDDLLWAEPTVATLAATGMRWGEVAGLKAKRVDLFAGTIHVREVMALGNLKAMPKGNASIRTIPVPSWLVDILTPLVAGEDPERVVLRGSRGNWLRPDTLTKHWAALCAKAGVPRITPHHLRHTQAALLLRDGYSAQEVAQRLGHSSAAFTLATYGYVLEGRDRDIADSLERLAPRRAAPTVPPAMPPSPRSPRSAP